jgi:hypothetical protein
MPSVVDDLPEQLDPNFSGYDPDMPYQKATQEMAYFKEGSRYGIISVCNSVTGNPSRTA